MSASMFCILVSPFLVDVAVMTCACCWVVCKTMQLRAWFLIRKPMDETWTVSDAPESNVFMQLNSWIELGVSVMQASIKV
jgi:hypothetical protein